ncbi:TadE family type IV pilus minor pilin [Kineosporia sp. R_H_3]|uniref:TadE family type IV pilus minor pilin n=1 Tax=Kineosporia sp. R_H_3 TaxID=1961848 RepID=UPI000B4BF0FD|nr:TadE family type IV pilus minor pilin [Kineosporia sp. R_H_3]
MRPLDRPSAPGAGWARERGTVTAETALALPAVVLVLGLVLGVVEVGGAQVRAVDAARAAARRAARGDSPGAVLAAARALAPAGATVSVGRSGGSVTVTVSAAVHVSLPGAPAVTVRARAVADAEEPS